MKGVIFMKNIGIVFAVVGLALMGLVVFLLLGSSADGQTGIAADQPVITVSGSADVLTAPDQIVITLGLESRHRDIAAAKSESDQKAARILGVAEHHQIDAKDIQMDYMDVKPCDLSVKNPYTSYESISPANLGYAVRRRLVVTIRDLARFEPFLADAIAQGVEYVQGVQFKTTEMRKFKDQAREEAVKAAREKAEAMAAALGQRAGKAVRITEQQEYYWSWYDSWYWGWYGGSAVSASNVTLNNNSAGQSGQGGDTVMPGQIKVRASVSVEFILD